MNPQIRALLFDKDGTLIDVFAGWVKINTLLFHQLVQIHPGPNTGEADLQNLLQTLGIVEGKPVPGGLLASGTEEDIMRAHHAVFESSAPNWELFRREVKSLTKRLLLDHPLPVVPVGRVRPSLVQLKEAGYRLGVATSDSLENALRDLKDHGADLIEFWATPDSLTYPKPHPESVLRFAEFVDLPPAAIGFVGDSLSDLQAARAAGAGTFIAIRSATCPPEVLSQADHVLDSIDGLAGYLG